MNQLQICGQMYIPSATPVMTGKVMKEERTRREWMIGNISNWYQFHVLSQGGSDEMTKGH